MDVEKSLSKVAGAWVGTNRKRMMPDEEYHETAAVAAVSLAAQGNAATFSYTWADEGLPQDGALLLTNGDEPGTVRAVWVDSWHQSPQWMEMTGEVDEHGVIRLEGGYSNSARWRLVVDTSDSARLRLAMDNVMPDMDLDYQAVEATYRRAE
ncbi:DUF1579 family protein [Actinokineospora sp.]|uniref:DUF1579 family protein n=1 Tax=Actinokineospora sp. TaxID=1872133 RepID=UPI004038020B